MEKTVGEFRHVARGPWRAGSPWFVRYKLNDSHALSAFWRKASCAKTVVGTAGGCTSGRALHLLWFSAALPARRQNIGLEAMTGEYLVQILLPLRDRDARPFARDVFDQVARELSERFGGMTAYARAPAKGLWEDPSGETELDDIIVHEVMTEALDDRWWKDYRASLEARFGQDEVVIRALAMHRV